ncbi:MAG TPA: hypothetical protein VM146_00445 [Steroidobacteraceae bacterium]|nr:hypothetical protein [Steroidobacteraceae bacterium]
MNKAAWVSGLAVVAAIAAALFFHQRGGSDAPAGPLSMPVYQVVKRHEPEVYARLLEQYRASQQGRITPADFANLASTAISEAATRRIGRAAPDAQLALMRDMVANLKTLRARNDDTCFRYLYPEIAGGADVAGALSPKAQARTLELAGEVIRTSAETPSTPTSREAAAKKLGPIVDAVYAQFGADTQLMGHVREPGIDRRKVCDIAIALYQRMLALPPAEASQLFSAVASPG